MYEREAEQLIERQRERNRETETGRWMVRFEAKILTPIACGGGFWGPF